MTELKLVNLTDLAHAVGFRILHAEPNISSWLKNADPQTAVPVYFTQVLWQKLGGDGPDQEAFAARAGQVLRSAHQTVVFKIIEGHGWRGSFRVEGQDPSWVLWLTVGHGYSDGMVVALGAGDLWAESNPLQKQ